MALAGVCPASERRPYRRPKYACCRNYTEALAFVLWGLCLSLVPMGGAITSPGHQNSLDILLKTSKTSMLGFALYHFRDRFWDRFVDFRV